ncbi:MAG: universal stress protein [Hyphomonadaceae bacterium]|nr:universal stress protein [Hyphomonadaceae bacterium]
MGWRDILVFADGSEDGLARARMAKEIADAHKAHLEVAVLAPAPAKPATARTEALAPAERAVAQLRDLVGSGAPGGVSVHVLECVPEETRFAAARAARTADLVIFGKPEKFDDSELDTDIFVGAIMEGGRPCLMLPRWINPRAWGKRGLIWWKGEPESARAVQGALPFLSAAEKVRVTVANPRGQREGEDERSLERLATYLLRHGVDIEETVARTSWEGSEYMIQSAIDGFNADFMVLGAYEGSRLVEDIFGGVTAKVVHDTQIPVLMAH